MVKEEEEAQQQAQQQQQGRVTRSGRALRSGEGAGPAAIDVNMVCDEQKAARRASGGPAGGAGAGAQQPPCTAVKALAGAGAEALNALGPEPLLHLLHGNRTCTVLGSCLADPPERCLGLAVRSFTGVQVRLRRARGTGLQALPLTVLVAAAYRIRCPCSSHTWQSPTTSPNCTTPPHLLPPPAALVLRQPLAALRPRV